jgi:hypothetical protein
MLSVRCAVSFADREHEVSLPHPVRGYLSFKATLFSQVFHSWQHLGTGWLNLPGLASGKTS